VPKLEAAPTHGDEPDHPQPASQRRVENLARHPPAAKNSPTREVEVAMRSSGDAIR
jgi:hypothetical protein